jgi:hypothetical protein
MPRTNCWALILIVLLSSSASYGQNYKNGEATHDLRVTGQLYEAVGQAASLFRTVIGVEEVASLPYVKPVKLQIEHATLTETMDAIIQADSRYSWRREPNGTIHVFSRAEQTTFPDVIIGSFEAKNLDRYQAVNRLDLSDGIRQWSKEHTCRRLDAIVIVGMPAPEKHEITLTTTGKTLRENLDEIALAAGTYYWIVSEAHARSGCEVSIQLPSPSIPRPRPAPAQPSK